MTSVPSCDVENNIETINIFVIKKRKELLEKKRTSAKAGLEEQAKKMKKMSNHMFPACKVGDTVKVRVPDVDRARSDSRNVLAVVLTIENDEFYQLGTKLGRLAQLYTRNQFAVSKEQFILLEDGPNETVSLRECARKLYI